jgi:acyl carrier protein
MIDDPVKLRLRAFVAKNFHLPDPDSFDDTTSFIDRGVIDSTGVLELVTFVEAEYGVAVADEEIVPANFDSISALAGFVARKRS